MSRRLPSLSSLRSFEAAARMLSFTKAAEELHVTPTAISHQIRALEDWLGVKLFERSTRAVRLSEAGQRYLPSVQAAFDGLETATEQIMRQDQANVVTVTTTVSFTSKWLISRLSDFQQQHPDIDVRITTSTELIDMARAGIDIGIRFGRGHWPDLIAHHLLTERVFPVCSPKLLNAEKPLRKPDDLSEHVLLHVSTLRDEWRVWFTAAGLNKLNAKRELVFDQMATALQAASEGLGVALGHTHLVADDIIARRLLAPFDLEIPGDFAYYVVYPKVSMERKAVLAFRDWLLAQAALTGTWTKN